MTDNSLILSWRNHFLLGEVLLDLVKRPEEKRT